MEENWEKHREHRVKNVARTSNGSLISLQVFYVSVRGWKNVLKYLGRANRYLTIYEQIPTLHSIY